MFAVSACGTICSTFVLAWKASIISRAVMPFASFKQITDTGVAALHLYLKSLPSCPADGR